MLTWGLKLIGRVLARRVANEALRGAFREAELRRQLEAETHRRAVREAERVHLMGSLQSPEWRRGTVPAPLPGSVTGTALPPLPALPAPEPAPEPNRGTPGAVSIDARKE